MGFSHDTDRDDSDTLECDDVVECNDELPLPSTTRLPLTQPGLPELWLVMGNTVTTLDPETTEMDETGVETTAPGAATVGDDDDDDGGAVGGG